MSDSDPTYDEACRVVGQCCLMLAQNGEEISRGQVAYQLKRLHWQIMELTGESNLPIKLAIEQLEDGL
ncbi:DUF2767 family protein [Serratia marcescens]|uniref:DUF2767 family protein n=1 Tax=Serratia sp. 1D1416 TaxID=2447890 RepID=UPI001013D265|nr:DUF2767 family protein [Serratia sp. 1D1416]MBN5198737.1 DUF2767 family protein [Serratia marcescens]